jgi:hypothetical protein
MDFFQLISILIIWSSIVSVCSMTSILNTIPLLILFGAVATLAVSIAKN